MALTALAGPFANLLIAFVFLFIRTLLVIYGYDRPILLGMATFMELTAIMSVGLMAFNLIPIPPLDGSKILSSLLPDRLYLSYMRIERYLLIVVVALAWFGFFSGPLGAGISGMVRWICGLFDFPFSYFTYTFGL